MLHRADAVGRHTLRLRDVLVARGIRSEIYVELVDPDTADDTRPFVGYADAAEPEDVLVYQFATASAMAPWLAARAETLVVNHHNVTPPQYYAPWDNAMARHQLLAEQQLRLLAPRAALGLAVSAFNEAELRAAGFARTAVVPPAAMLPTSGPDAMLPMSGPDATPAGRPGTDSAGARWIGVGRLAPNKGIEFALMALLVARAHDDPGATLEVVGRPVVPAYTSALRRLVDELGLRQAVTFTGALPDDDVAQRMARADVLVVGSRHEGFGLPLLEAMTLRLPVVANRVGALPEVVGDGAVLVDATDPWALAAAVAQVRGDAEFRHTLAAAGQRRLAELDLPTAGDRAVDAILAAA